MNFYSCTLYLWYITETLTFNCIQLPDTTNSICRNLGKTYIFMHRASSVFYKHIHIYFVVAVLFYLTKSTLGSVNIRTAKFYEISMCLSDLTVFCKLTEFLWLTIN